MPEGQTPDPARAPEVLPLPLRGSPEPLTGRCCSPLPNRPGRYCTQYPLQGKTRCRKHGGLSLRGIASPLWKTGVYSKDLPIGLAGAYQRARTNPDLIANYEQVALYDALISECLGRLKDLDPGPDWDLVRAVDAAFQVFEGAQKTKNVGAMMSSLTDIKGGLAALKDAHAGQQGYLDVREQLAGLIEQRRKLVDSEVKRRKDAQEMILKTQVIGLMGAIAQSVLRNVRDPRERQAITDDMRLLMTGPRA